jgi:hypothetical protein
MGKNENLSLIMLLIFIGKTLGSLIGIIKDNTKFVYTKLCTIFLWNRLGMRNGKN